jgi:hypothetical protein
MLCNFDGFFDIIGAKYEYFVSSSGITSIPLNPRSVTGRPKTKSNAILTKILYFGNASAECS